MKEIMIGLLNYSFSDIEWKWENLTDEEKSVIGSKEKFSELRNYCNPKTMEDTKITWEDHRTSLYLRGTDGSVLKGYAEEIKRVTKGLYIPIEHVMECKGVFEVRMEWKGKTRVTKGIPVVLLHPEGDELLTEMFQEMRKLDEVFGAQDFDEVGNEHYETK
jgi:hypothetical protein